MTFHDYSWAARSTAKYSGISAWDGVEYNTLKLSGEAGEIADIVGKIKGKGTVATPEQRAKLKLELGDVLWHLTNLALDLGLTMDEVAEANLAKLNVRNERGDILGDGLTKDRGILDPEKMISDNHAQFKKQIDQDSYDWTVI